MLGFNAFYNGNGSGGFTNSYTGYSGLIETMQDNGQLAFETNGASQTAAASFGLSERLDILQNGNVGIGTAMPGSLLSVNGSAAFGSYGGNGTAPPSNGMIVSGAVGIGTNNPLSYALDVVGNANISGTVSATSFSGSGSGLTGVTVSASNISGIVPIANGGTNAAAQSNNGVNYFNGTSITSGTGFVYTGGDVGIGTSTPLEALDVRATVAGGIFMTSNDYTGNTGAPILRVQGIRVDGNTSQDFAGGVALEHVYIGTSTVSGSALGSIYFGGNYDAARDMAYPASIGGVAEGTFIGTSSAPAGLAFYTGSTSNSLGTPNVSYGAEHMRITSAGNVGIGTTSPRTKLEVSGTSPNITLTDTSQGADGKVFDFYNQGALLQGRLVNDAYNSATNWLDVSRTGMTVNYVAFPSGAVGIGTTAPQSKLHVQAGEIQTGSSGNACGAANAGAIRYASGSLYYCDNASTWETLDSSGSGNNGDWEEL